MIFTVRLRAFGASAGQLLPESLSKSWSGKRDSNPRLRPWQGRTLPLSYSRSPNSKRNTLPVLGSRWSVLGWVRVEEPFLVPRQFLVREPFVVRGSSGSRTQFWVPKVQNVEPDSERRTSLRTRNLDQTQHTEP